MKETSEKYRSYFGDCGEPSYLECLKKADGKELNEVYKSFLDKFWVRRIVPMKKLAFRKDQFNTWVCGTLIKYGEWQWGIVEDDNWKNCDYANVDNTACYRMHSKKAFVGGCGSAEGITFIENFAADCDRDCWTTKMSHFSSEFDYSDSYLRSLYYGYR